jgi:hypothetical protein
LVVVVQVVKPQAQQVQTAVIQLLQVLHPQLAAVVAADKLQTQKMEVMADQAAVVLFQVVLAEQEVKAQMAAQGQAAAVQVQVAVVLLLLLQTQGQEM